ncbi:unnamed protein product [Didymodactylos carnosus]|uniref:TRPM SLOG domain-containing protein n=1 Tax=Didymodactylos carnosus TaxID=1234261 RepID=A0A8S2N5N1_9BILA|nr:unnamed protein product [Didymodactylos carnosus]CAF3986542.1 unnamed protein product [Didymodactylos carnosus]
MTAPEVNISLFKILLNGDQSSLSIVYDAIDDNIPVIAVKDTGGLADFIAIAYKVVYPSNGKTEEELDKTVKKMEKTEFKNEIRDEIRTKIQMRITIGTDENIEEDKVLLSFLTDQTIEEFVNKIIKPQGYFLINILEYDNGRAVLALSDGILQAMLFGKYKYEHVSR